MLGIVERLILAMLFIGLVTMFARAIFPDGIEIHGHVIFAPPEIEFWEKDAGKLVSLDTKIASGWFVDNAYTEVTTTKGFFVVRGSVNAFYEQSVKIGNIYDRELREERKQLCFEDDCYYLVS